MSEIQKLAVNCIKVPGYTVDNMSSSVFTNRPLFYCTDKVAKSKPKVMD